MHNSHAPELPTSSAAEALHALGVDASAGLMPAEAQARLRQYGPNEIPEQKSNPWLAFAGKFWGLTAWMLEAIIVLSWLLKKYEDVGIVSALLVINALLSFAQESRASRVVDELRQRLQVNARVLRGGAWGVLPARELVPGDIVRLRAGDFVPADAKVSAGDVALDQSALTGESLLAERGPDGLLYSGSVVRRGEASAVVVLTGVHTFFGRTAQLVQIARPRLHIEDVVSRVVQWLLAIVGALLVVALVASLVRGLPLLDILPLMLVLLLGAIPVALPVMFTVSMAFGSLELARKGVLVTRLSASEDAASMDVLCVDKTGTVTENRLALSQVIPYNGFSAAQVVRYGALASEEANHDPLDRAFLNAARERGLSDPGFEVERFIPFDPQTRRTEAIVQRDGREFRAMKGALRAIAQACGLDEAAAAELETHAAEWALKGQRAMAVAWAEGQETPRLAGLVTLYDPPRPDSRELIQRLGELGVRVKLLTGDALPIAQSIAHEVGLTGEVQRVADLEALLKVDPARAGELAERSAGFAEMYPEGKYNVVKSLQARGHVVGMTGDGVNDAPALRQAEVGIAVRDAVDVAKGAASVVLTQEGLTSIVDLVINGRRIYQRIATWIVNKISRTILKSAFVVAAFLLTGKYVISAFGMILVVFMTDFAKISLATDNVRPSQQPDTWNVTGMVKTAVVLGLAMVVEALGLLWIGWQQFRLAFNESALHTFTYETLLFFAIFSLLAVRNRGRFWASRPSRTLGLALLADGLLATLIGTLGLAGLAPLPLWQTLFVLAYAGVFSLLVNDWIKTVLLQPADA